MPARRPTIEDLEAASQLLRASLELRLRSPAAVGALLDTRGAQTDAAGALQLRDAQTVGRHVERVARRLPWRPTCLRQSLAAQRMLARRGIPYRVHLGVSPARQAHAWVTVAGRPIVGAAGLERFVPLER